MELTKGSVKLRSPELMIALNDILYLLVHNMTQNSVQEAMRVHFDAKHILPARSGGKAEESACGAQCNGKVSGKNNGKKSGKKNHSKGEPRNNGARPKAKNSKNQSVKENHAPTVNGPQQLGGGDPGAARKVQPAVCYADPPTQPLPGLQGSFTGGVYTQQHTPYAKGTNLAQQKSSSTNGAKVFTTPNDQPTAPHHHQKPTAVVRPMVAQSQQNPGPRPAPAPAGQDRLSDMQEQNEAANFVAMQAYVNGNAQQPSGLSGVLTEVGYMPQHLLNQTPQMPTSARHWVAASIDRSARHWVDPTMYDAAGDWIPPSQRPLSHDPTSHDPTSHDPMSHDPMSHDHMSHDPPGHSAESAIDLTREDDEITAQSYALWRKSLNCDVCHALLEAITQPRRLKHLCRLTVKATLGARFPECYTELPLPPTIKNYVGDLSSC